MDQQTVVSLKEVSYYWFPASPVFIVSTLSPTGGENWELMAATLFVKKLVKSSAVREAG